MNLPKWANRQGRFRQWETASTGKGFLYVIPAVETVFTHFFVEGSARQGEGLGTRLNVAAVLLQRLFDDDPNLRLRLILQSSAAFAYGTFRIIEVAKHHYMGHLGTVPIGAIMSTKKFDGLPADARAAFEKFGGEPLVHAFAKVNTHENKVLETRTRKNTIGEYCQK